MDNAQTLDDNPTASLQEAAEAAFLSGFGNESQPEALSQPAEPKKEEPKPEELAVEVKIEPEAAPAPDPMASLPESVRKALESIPTLESELRRTAGQVRALQSARDREAAAAAHAAAVAAEAAAPRSEAYQTVQTQLPEVIATIEEIVASKLKKTEPAQVETPADEVDDRLPDEKRLDEGFPEWRQIAAGNDFKTWVSSQQDAAVIRSTDNMVTFMGAITRFKAHEAAQKAIAQEAARVEQTRASRIGASVAPPRAGAARRSTPTQSVEDAFLAGFNGDRV